METNESSIEQRLQALEVLHRNFQIVGGSNITVEGSLRHGFALCSTCPQVAGEEEGGGGIIVTTPPIPTGACCHVNGTCSIETEDWCTNEIHSDYQGDGTVCEDVDCSCTGACCHLDCSCTHTTLEHCDGDHFCGLTCTDIGACCAEPCCDYAETFRPLLIGGVYYQAFHFDTRDASYHGDVAAGSPDDRYVTYYSDTQIYDEDDVLICEETLYTTCECQNGGDCSTCVQTYWTPIGGTITEDCFTTIPHCSVSHYRLTYESHTGLQEDCIP